MTRPKTPGNVTPVMQQFLDAKAEVPDALVLFRMGDFYETFFEDAETAARVLDITLTARDKQGDNPIPMAGVPHHALDAYLPRLLEAGLKVAICDQMEDPAKARGIVRRAITRVVTPGVILDPGTLDSGRNNFLAALVFSLRGSALAYLDASCGEFRGTLVEDPALLRSELARVGPAEILVAPGAEASLQPLKEVLKGATVTPLEPAWFTPEDDPDTRRLLDAGGPGTPPTEVLAAAAALLRYVRGTQRGRLPSLEVLETYQVRDFMVLDETAVTDLELLRTIRGGDRRGTLLWVLDGTRTPMGRRLLKRWLLYPLVRTDAIERRLDAVEELGERSIERERLREYLGDVADLERLLARVQAGQGNARDVLALGRSLERLRPVREALQGTKAPLLRELAGRIDPLPALSARILESLVEEPPVTVREGGMFRPGISAELDDLAELARGGREWIARFEAEQREKTGIASLKVRFNRVFGYYIEVTRANLHLVPAEGYLRKQTMVNGERFYTPELKEYEEKVLTAQERQYELEARLFEELRDAVGAQARALGLTAGGVAELDVLLALAQAARENGYTRPVVDYSGVIDLRDGRHPVVERLLPARRFVPNDVRVDVDSNQLLIITGPNMAGKSTVMRQVALTVIMAQMGSFVPAASAVVGVADRVFTRVGASDALTRGLSTFMVEMNEAAEILRRATRRSLVILDEIGRGTSTYDGLAIAWAVAEHLHDVIGPRTLFATHYHELTQLTGSKVRVSNWNIAVKEFNDEIFFLHKLVEGATNRSYGVQVARLAGVPAPVIARAKEILVSLEDSGDPRRVIRKGRPVKRRPPAGVGDLFTPAAGEADSPLEERLRRLDPNAVSPMEALALLFELRGLLDP
ncbi:MAG: DNA mismatch repair protein MutS [Deltaproteobacteria bacterium]|nr:DNA mismatch repair protein MutS [Deltaproteobacteria bacterium]